jgi:Cu/Ag efflux protein CusF
MLKTLVTVLTLVLAVSGAAWAADVEGKIKSVDMAEKSFVLEDGTKVWVGEGVSMDKLKEGAEVKASYDMKDGKNMATSVEVKE